MLRLFDKFLFWGSYLFFFCIILIIYLAVMGTVSWMIAIIWLILFILFIYMRFVEPQIIVVKNESFKFASQNRKSVNIKIVLIADQHLGVFKNHNFLKKTVYKINKLNPNLVLIAGDLIYNPTQNQLKILYAEMVNIKAPIYAVAGNHDSEKPGYFTSDEVRKAISPFKVNFIDNKKVSFKFSGKNLNIYGLSDYNENKIDFSEINKITKKENAIILAHHPESSHCLPNYNADLFLVGHTHGGQVRIPLIYKKLIPAAYGFNRGWHEYKGLHIYVTSGIGEVLLPMRFLVSPEIVVMNIQI